MHLKNGQEIDDVPSGEKPNGMHFEHYLASLGTLSEFRMMRQAGVPHGVVENIRNAIPIPAVYAQKIADWLSSEFGRTIEVQHIKGLRVVAPGGPPAQV